jgi:hypothetical protein
MVLLVMQQYRLWYPSLCSSTDYGTTFMQLSATEFVQSAFGNKDALCAGCRIQGACSSLTGIRTAILLTVSNNDLL